MHKYTKVGMVLDEIKSIDNWRTANGTVLGNRLLSFRDLHTTTRYDFSIQTDSALQKFRNNKYYPE